MLPLSSVGDADLVAPQSQFLTVKEAAAYLRVSPSTIYRLLKRKALPATFRIGTDWRIELQALKAWTLSLSIDSTWDAVKSRREREQS